MVNVFVDGLRSPADITDKEKEEILNERLGKMTEQEAVDQFAYMTSETRLKHTSEANVRKQWREKRLGSLMKRLDKERFDATQW